MVSSGGEKTSNTFSRSPLGIVAILIVAIALISALVFFSTQTDSGDGNDTSSNGSIDAGRVAFKEGDFDTTEEKLEAVIEKDPDNAEAYKLLGLSYEAKGKLTKAADAYKASLDADSDQPEVIYNLAGILNQSGKTDEATELMEKAVKIDEDFMAAKLFLGDLYAKQGEVDYYFICRA